MRGVIETSTEEERTHLREGGQYQILGRTITLSTPTETPLESPWVESHLEISHHARRPEVPEH